MKMLVIEDNRDIAENIADYFEPLGHVLDFAQDGEQGLQMALSEDFDVIVLDLMLPRMDGFTLCRKLRETHNATPVLMLTARDQLADKLQGFEEGADDYLVKPFSVKELEARLKALLKRLQQFGQHPQLKLADLVYDTNTQQASRAGKSLDLNPTQRKILLYLMQRSPNVVKRAELETLIWGDQPPDNDILRTHIYSLRSMIDKPFDSRLLHTVHGLGYRLVEETP